MNELLLARARSHLWSSPKLDLRATVAGQRRAYERATFLVRAFYAAGVALMLIQTSQWVPLLEVSAIDPQWPAAWLRSVDVGTGVRAILVGHVLATLWAMVRPDSRWARTASFVMLLQYMAMVNGFGKINHDIHAWLWVSGLLIFLPDRWDQRRRVAERHHFLTVLWACQLVVLLFYTLTGLWKVYWALRDLVAPGVVSSLQIDGFSYIVADRILVTNQDTLLGEVLIQNPVLGWLLYNGTMYLEVTSILIAFRPRLHRLWGVGLIAFHIGTQLAMGFTFRHNVVLIGLLFVCSPWAPERPALRELLLDLPGVHVTSRQMERLCRRRSLAVEPA